MSNPTPAWQCLRCGTRNLPSSTLCARCGAARGAPARRSGATRATAAGRSSAAAGSPALAASLSAILPGLGQAYRERWRRGVLMLVAPVLVYVLVGALVAIVDPLTSFVLRHAPLATLLVIGSLFVFHLFVVGDAFAGRLDHVRDRRPLDYAVLGLLSLALVAGYATLYRTSAPWAALAGRMFAPFSNRATASGTDAAGPQWTGSERLNVLVLGVDTRDADPSTQNTDTMLVMSLDPLNRTAAMLSVPRDIYIDRPGTFVGKINGAFGFGGPRLAERVVSDLIGVPIHSYAIINFDSFKTIIDGVGGVLVDVRRPLRDEAYPTEDYGVERLRIVPGPQLMSGDIALRYARSRHDTNDYSRAMRQQLIVGAMRTKLAEPGALRVLPRLIDTVGTTVETDFDPAGALPLARSGTAIASADIRSEVLYPCVGDASPHCELTETNNGGFYQIPILAKVRDLAASVFYDPKIRAEGAHVEVQSTGARAGVARDVGDRLAQRAYGITDVTTAAAARSAIVLRNPAKQYTADQLRQVLGNLPLETAAGDGTGPDIIVRIGSDFRGFATDFAK